MVLMTETPLIVCTKVMRLTLMHLKDQKRCVGDKNNYYTVLYVESMPTMTFKLFQ